MGASRPVLVALRSRLAWLIVVSGLLAPVGEPPSAQQPYYRWVDEKGVVNYSQFPPPASEAPPEPAKPPPSAPAVRREAVDVGPPKISVDGTVDYAAALNARYGQGVTPENNAAVPLIRALGPGVFLADEKVRSEILRRLGMPSLPEKGDYWTGSESEPAEIFKAYQAPWQESEYPAMAAWLRVNEKLLALVLEASKRSRFWTPVVETKNGDIAPLLLYSKFLMIGRALGARAMRKFQAGDVVGAWSDLLAGQRLARLLSRQYNSLALSVGVAVEMIMGSGVSALGGSGKITTGQARAFLSDVRALRPFASATEIIDHFERIYALSLRARARTKEDWEAMAASLETPALASLSPEAHIDWNESLLTINRCFDRAVAAHRKPSFTARRQALLALSHEIEVAQSRARQTLGPESVRALLQTGPDAAARATLGRALGRLTCSSASPAFSLAAQAVGRAELSLRLNETHLALAAYRAEKGTFPARLEELTPGDLARVPKDPFTDEALTYQRRGAGYTLSDSPRVK